MDSHRAGARQGLRRRTVVGLIVAGLVLAGLAVSASSGPASAVDAGATPAPSGNRSGPGFNEHHGNGGEIDVNVCSRANGPGTAHCDARVRTDTFARQFGEALRARGVTPGVTPAVASPTGPYAPADLRVAYNVPSSPVVANPTVAIVDAYDDPNAEADLATYRTQYSLPVCSTQNGCFQKVNQSGATSPLPAPDAGWAQEESLDLDMVSAMCSQCHILLVEANSNSFADLGPAINQAVAMGAVAVSNSYGGGAFSTEGSFDSSYLDHPGVAITVSSGDAGYGVEYPAASPNVIAVGGTSLTNTNSGATYSETAWSGAGSGCSLYETSKPAWQHDTGCSLRTVADMSAVADPNTGVLVYDGYGVTPGWYIFGGTSVASPITASIYALAYNGNPWPNLPASYLYSHPTNLHDVTSGSNGTCSVSYLCNAVIGYDGPTGIGTPNGITAFSAAVTTPDFGISLNPTTASVSQGSPAEATVNTLATGTPETVNLSVSGLPAGATATLNPTSVTSGASSTLNISTGTAAAGTYTLTVTGTAASGGSGGPHSATFALTINTAQQAGITNGGFEAGNLTGWTTAGATSDVSSGCHSGTWCAQVGSTSPSTNSSAAQTFIAPAAATQLSFWYKVVCHDTITYDWAGATLKDVTANTTTTVLPNTCTNTGAWKQATAAITARDTYTLTLSNHDDNYPGDPTDTLYDDVTVNSVAPSDFSISANPTSLSVAQGANGTSTISTTAINAAESIALSASGLPSGVTASFNPTSVTAGGSSTLTLTASSTAATGPATVTVTGTAASNGPHATTVSLTITTPVAGGIVNGGFETGSLSGWTSSGAATSVVSSGCHSGTWCARAGTTTPTNGNSSVAQTFTIPTGKTSLSFYYKVVCPDTVTYDWATATLKDNTTNTTTTVLPKTCTNAGAWVKVSATVTVGHSYTLTLTSRDDNYPGDPTYTLYDDVTLN